MQCVASFSAYCCCCCFCCNNNTYSNVVRQNWWRRRRRRRRQRRHNSCAMDSFCISSRLDSPLCHSFLHSCLGKSWLQQKPISSSSSSGRLCLRLMAVTILLLQYKILMISSSRTADFFCADRERERESLFAIQEERRKLSHDLSACGFLCFHSFFSFSSGWQQLLHLPNEITRSQCILFRARSPLGTFRAPDLTGRPAARRSLSKQTDWPKVLN